MKIFPFSRFIVEDRSMVPAYLPGDHVLTFNWLALKKNDVVVFKEANTFFIKRIVKAQGKFFICKGDNTQVSTKTHSVAFFGLVGKVILKY